MESLNVTLVQSSLVWENREENLLNFQEKLQELKGATDLIVLPEMFNTGFSMRTERLAEEMNGPTIKWMRQMSRDLDAVITGSLIIKENDQYFNRLVWVEPWDLTGTYDKRHLFRMAGEHHHFSPGRQRLITTMKGWRICPLICYDLRFPVWSRNQNDYDLLIYIANWPEVRHDAWNTLLKARAIENQSYVVGVNRIGLDGNDIGYAGESIALDPQGKAMHKSTGNRETLVTVTLDYESLSKYRTSFPVGLDADEFSVG